MIGKWETASRFIYILEGTMGKYFDGMLGFVVGDSLGVPFEFKKRGTFTANDMVGFGTHLQPAGTWSDDSSMTLCTAESLARLNRIDPNDIMNNFKMWLLNADFTPYGMVFDIGRRTQLSIELYADGVSINECGGSEIYDNGNGALMRVLPIAMLPDCVYDQTLMLQVSHLTHSHRISDLACLIYVAIVKNLISRIEKNDAVFGGINRYKNEINEYFSRNGLLNIKDLKREDVKSSGYVVDTLEAALWCFYHTDTYTDCVLEAVNLGGDTDTIAAITGGLAGIYYGIDNDKGIPDEWISMIARKEWVINLCRKFEDTVMECGENGL